MTTPAEILARAVQLHQRNELQQAATLYQQILQSEPGHAEALHLLGVVALQRGNLAVAIDLISQAIASNDQVIVFHTNLAAAYHAAGRYEASAASCRAAIRLNPASAEAHNNLGAALKHLGKTAEAVACYRQAVQLKNDYADAWKNLGSTLYDQGEAKAAIEPLERAVQLQPRFAEAHRVLGAAQRKLGQNDQALASYQRALQVSPNSPEALHGLANLIREQGDHSQAIALYRRALDVKPDYAEAQCHLGCTLAAAGEFDEALICYARALELRPDYSEAYFNQALSLAQLGRFDEAAACCKKALEIEPDNLKARRLLHDTTPAADESDQIETLRDLAQRDSTTVEERAEACFTLGGIFDRQADYQQAFQWYQTGNDGLDPGFDRAGHTQHISAIIDRFPPSLFAKRVPNETKTVRPIFIIGMPRSGTTLVEQILCSHEAVFGAGELEDIRRLAQAVPGPAGQPNGFPQMVADLESATLAQMVDEYVASASRLASGEPRLTDKMPSNFLYLGLIALLFPGAHVIHCRRHPLDTCLSCYFQKFNHLPFSFNLENLGHYYQEYQRLMAHWQACGSELPVRLFEVDYEHLVGNLESTSRALVEHCGLAWDERILEFHTTLRPVRTASLWQVRQPIYSSSVGRWRHYEQYLGPLMPLVDRRL